MAIFLPIIEEWCKKRDVSPSKLLMPLSFVTILGGMITVIGTSTNVLASGIAKDLGYEEFSLFQFYLFRYCYFPCRISLSGIYCASPVAQP